MYICMYVVLVVLKSTYHSKSKGNISASFSSASILTKNVARSFGIHRINELEFSLNVIFGGL